MVAVRVDGWAVMKGKRWAGQKAASTVATTAALTVWQTADQSGEMKAATTAGVTVLQTAERKAA